MIACALARKFRETADAENDPPAKYVLLREAREFAIDGGDMPYAMEVIDDMAKTFAINVVEMKASAMSIGFDKSNVPPVDLANSYLKVADDALAVWDLDLAHKAAYLARKISTGNRDMIALADQRDKIIRLRNHDLMGVVQAEKKIGKSPDDPQLNLLIGRHLCFNTNHWETGLPYLAKSPPGPVTNLAAKDLASPSDPAGMASLADGWWDLADAKNSIPAGAGHRRAAYWYAKALPGLSGDRKTMAEQRIATAESDLRKP